MPQYTIGKGEIGFQCHKLNNGARKCESRDQQFEMTPGSHGVIVAEMADPEIQSDYRLSPQTTDVSETDR